MDDSTLAIVAIVLSLIAIFFNLFFLLKRRK